MRLAILASHPIQYQAPLFRELARRLDVVVFFAHRASAVDQSAAGFGVGFDWDIDLLDGYDHEFLENRASRPGLDHFAGCDTPAIHEALKQGAFDALLVMGWHRKTFWQGILAAKRLGRPVLVRGDSQLATPRSALKRIVKTFLYPVGLRLFDAALYVGERSRQYWRHYYYPNDRLFFSPHCVDNGWFAERATPDARRALRVEFAIGPEAPVVLFAGKLQPFKRPLDVAEAAARVAKSFPDLVVLVAGAGELSSAMTEAAQLLGVRLIHLGFCNQSRMPAVYAAADVLVLPSGQETWGLVANEALACGRPVIVSAACGCAADLAADGQAGGVFPVGDTDRLAGSLRVLLHSPPSATALASRAAAYSLVAAADGVMAALAKVVSA